MDGEWITIQNVTTFWLSMSKEIGCVALKCPGNVVGRAVCVRVLLYDYV